MAYDGYEVRNVLLGFVMDRDLLSSFGWYLYKFLAVLQCASMPGLGMGNMMDHHAFSGIPGSIELQVSLLSLFFEIFTVTLYRL